MDTTRLPLMLRMTRWLVLATLLATGILVMQLLAGAVAVGSQPEVRLQLQTDRPALFSFWHGMQQGYADGKAGQRRPEREVRPALQLAAGRTFELAADPATPVLRYHEPSALRREALLLLGALPDGQSVAGLLLVGLGGWLLLQLLRDVTPAAPFTPANARRLYLLTLLVLALNLWDYVARVAVLLLVPAYRAPGVAAPLNQYVSLNSDEWVPGFLVGFILFIIAAVYQRGVVLSQEAELII